MSNLKLGSSYALERGIDSIVDARGNDLAALPQLQDSPPCEVSLRPQVESLLQLHTLDNQLDEAVRPEMESRELMAPVRFRQGLDRVLGILRMHAEAGAAGSGPDPAQEDRLPVLTAAVRLLAEECELRDMVQKYRSVLYQA